MFFSRTRTRQLKLRSTPFLPAWREILHRRFPLLSCLSPEDQRELEGHIQVFLAEKQFEGCDGLVITDEIRVVIAAQACLLLLHRDTDYYPDLKSILVYPSTYFSRVTEEDEEQKAAFPGQSWLRGPVILAWDAVQGGGTDRSNGQNAMFQELAHQWDAVDGRMDGFPEAAAAEQSTVWICRVGAGNWADEVEGPLGDAFRRAARAVGLPEADRCKYEASATHHGVYAGAFDKAEAQEQVVAFIREMITADGRPLEEALLHDAALNEFVDLKQGGLDAESQEQPDALKQKLHYRLVPKRVEAYRARWERTAWRGFPAPIVR